MCVACLLVFSPGASYLALDVFDILPLICLLALSKRQHEQLCSEGELRCLDWD